MPKSQTLFFVQVDLELAKAEADKVEDDEPLRKKLWLRIAKHVIEQVRWRVVGSLSEARPISV